MAERPIRRLGGFLPLEELALLGDGYTCALVGRDGSIPWLCLPRSDSEPIFGALLDADSGGAFVVAPDGLTAADQRYEPETALVETELVCATGRVRLTDALLLQPGADLTEDARHDCATLVRMARVVDGTVRLRVALSPWGGAHASVVDGTLRLCPVRRPGLTLELRSSRPLAGPETTFELRTGDELELFLRWDGTPAAPRLEPGDGRRALASTRAAWHRWMRHVTYAGSRAPVVRRSAIALKLLDYFEAGSVLAAPTTSLPEAIGGVRNWDYRYAWIRDAAFSVYALRRIGCGHEADGFLAWVLRCIERHGAPRVLYTLEGTTPPPEREEPALGGYRGSGPVRFGNAAADQHQHDVYGEILDCAWQWASGGGDIGPRLWKRLARLANRADREWEHPDAGIWEIRAAGRPFTYSAALCQVALDRAARLSRRQGLPGDPGRWARKAAMIRERLVEDAWHPGRRSFVESLGGDALDASLLALPLRHVLPATHPRMVATTEAITRGLGAGGGLLYRYRPEEAPDGLPGHEGAFLLCSFWLVENLALQGRTDEAQALFESLCDRAGPLGLLPEQVDPSTGAFRGNYPQAFSHVGVISSAVTLARLERGRRAERQAAVATSL